MYISVYVYIHTYVYCAIHIRIINIILYFQFQVLSSFLDMCASPCPAPGTRAQWAFQCFLQAAVARTTPSRWLYLEKQKMVCSCLDHNLYFFVICVNIRYCVPICRTVLLNYLPTYRKENRDHPSGNEPTMMIIWGHWNCAITQQQSSRCARA